MAYVENTPHNPEVVGSNPAPATKNLQLGSRFGSRAFFLLLASAAESRHGAAGRMRRGCAEKGRWGTDNLEVSLKTMGEFDSVKPLLDRAYLEN